MAKDLDEEISKDTRAEVQLREMRAKERMASAKCSKRMEVLIITAGLADITKLTAATKWSPRLERLAKRLELTEFEKFILLTLAGIWYVSPLI